MKLYTQWPPGLSKRSIESGNFRIGLHFYLLYWVANSLHLNKISWSDIVVSAVCGCWLANRVPYMWILCTYLIRLWTLDNLHFGLNWLYFSYSGDTAPQMLSFPSYVFLCMHAWVTLCTVLHEPPEEAIFLGKHVEWISLYLQFDRKKICYWF